jgi:type II secretory ATPase GspE/PulE/Tfp pilus assembly ATPase PilB-like protein
MQSIEDLIVSSQGGDVDEESVLGKFKDKEAQIKVTEEERVAESAAAQTGVPYINLFGFPISPEAIALISEKDSVKIKAISFFYDGENIRIGTTCPDSPAVKKKMNEICEEYHVKGKIYLISEHSYKYALDLYRMLPKLRKFITGVEVKPEDLERFKDDITDYKSLNTKINEVNVSDVVTLMLATAMKVNSSDIHIEAEEAGIAVRIRVDGVLQEAAVIEKDKWKKIVSRMKLLAKVKINITKKPQDGRFSIFLADETINVRVSFLPTAFGESVVMRLLFSKSVGLPFVELGIHSVARKILEKEIKKPNGLILTTGPTGSGKTTTLYAILKKLNDSETKIITLENPIEYQLKGINQSQINQGQDYTFAKGLRSILRQDPDIVMVGEIRDLETAEISIQASLTGHLVLSTLHTNDASGVIPRLIDMGVKPYFLTPAINAVIGQRLVRKICTKCRVEHVLTEEDREKVEKILAVISPKAEVDIPNKIPKIYKAGEGCPECSGIGYKGRIGIYEVFTMTDNIKELTSKNAPAFKILQQAIENGMLTMLQDGVLKTIEGVTSLEEVYRVIGKFDYIDAIYDVVVSDVVGRGIKLSETVLARADTIAKSLITSNDEINKTSVKEMIDIVMALAVRAEAGDIHIEPGEDGVAVRFRVDGILHNIATISKEHYIQVLSKMKILAGFATNVKKATMDGRFNVSVGKIKMDCRLSIISGGYGETIVVRLLTSQAAMLKMEDLGISSVSLVSINKSIKKTKGIIITTGPTGSGKTTTLYSILNTINKPDIKIITIEDPIEYHLSGIMQTQIDIEKGYTFSAAMRSLMRQNPNVIMVGEIRDSETAKTAIEASMTGHLVLSTIHANSAAGSIARFVGLDVERQALASSIECAMGQRLVRRICKNCKTEVETTPELLEQVKKVLSGINEKANIEIPKQLKFYKGKGCEKCNGIGFKGRIGIYEVIDMTPEMQKLIQKSDVTDYDIEEEAMKNGTVLLIQDGILKALQGETTPEEVFRVAL